jgi:hypothetical protein
MEKFKSESLDLRAKARGVLRGVRKESTDIDALVNSKSIAEAKRMNYTANLGRSDRIKGLRKEVEDGTF